MSAAEIAEVEVLPLTREWIEISAFALDKFAILGSPSYEGVD